ncbi:heterokaryon incompatibility protein-domain-containing protein, partial [Rhexocercosporidium sp. MPI-PUGE-AT-0058]
MRLLQINDDGWLSLTTYFADRTPPYAIFSHTWNDEEIIFEDLKNGTHTRNASYKKIRFCGEQARRDGLQYFWVDTCCIDKSSSSELTEAINSMFRWYRESTKCYVYLSDVSTGACDENHDISRSTWKLAFRQSRWFTRGWTLQELIAPTSVEFFSSDYVRLGDKRSMEQQIYEITRIPIRALRGYPLSEFSVAQRLSWAENRQTTRPEDKAYSLLGIFNFHMPLIYGEGIYALQRLQKEIVK